MRLKGVHHGVLEPLKLANKDNPIRFNELIYKDGTSYIPDPTKENPVYQMEEFDSGTFMMVSLVEVTGFNKEVYKGYDGDIAVLDFNTDVLVASSVLEGQNEITVDSSVWDIISVCLFCNDKKGGTRQDGLKEPDRVSTFGKNDMGSITSEAHYAIIVEGPEEPESLSDIMLQNQTNMIVQFSNDVEVVFDKDPRTGKESRVPVKFDMQVYDRVTFRRRIYSRSNTQVRTSDFIAAAHNEITAKVLVKTNNPVEASKLFGSTVAAITTLRNTVHAELVFVEDGALRIL